jgi:hypothetical protein
MLLYNGAQQYATEVKYLKRQIKLIAWNVETVNNSQKALNC